MSERLNAGAAVARILHQANVRHVFGLLGGSMLELYDALYRRNDIRYVGARDERAATHIADTGNHELQIANPGEPQNCLGDSGGPAR